MAIYQQIFMVRERLAVPVSEPVFRHQPLPTLQDGAVGQEPYTTQSKLQPRVFVAGLLYSVECLIPVTVHDVF